LSYESNATQYSTQIQLAVQYLVSHYDSSLGLVYESEDPGVSWLRSQYLDFDLSYPQVYWLYSDNLFSSLALAQWEPAIAANVSRTISQYHVPPSGKFEAVNGSVIGLDRDASNIIIERTSTYAILIRIHNGSLTGADWYYADDATYRALSLYYEGHTQEAATWLSHVFDMWNGTCLADESTKPAPTSLNGAPTDANYCDQFEVGLALFAARVLDINYAQIRSMEQFLWSAQNELGGIRSLTQNGIPLGTANCETTSLALLQYDSVLIEKLRNQTASTQSTAVIGPYATAVAPPTSRSTMLAISSLIVVVLVIIAFVVAFGKRKGRIRLKDGM
jgi:hypothetical protein